MTQNVSVDCQIYPCVLRASKPLFSIVSVGMLVDPIRYRLTRHVFDLPVPDCLVQKVVRQVHHGVD